MDIFKSFEKSLGLLNSVENSFDELVQKQSELDLKIQFWLHTLENEKIDTKKSYRITRELKALRRERREIKNNLELLQSFKTSSDKMNNSTNRSMLLGQLRKVKNRQENWVYTNDIYSKEDIERILG